MAAKKSGSKRKTRDINDVIDDCCLYLPGTEQFISHGSRSYKAGKVFAMLQVNHHGDGRLGLWLAAPPGAQALYTESEPKHYYVPPYVGPKGWLGVDLLSGLDWHSVGARIREAYIQVAPKKLQADLPLDLPDIEGPDRLPTLEELDPMQRQLAKDRLAVLDEICLALPETSRGEQFGNASWKAGKKTFATTHHRKGRLQFSFRVGGERQSMLVDDPRFNIPPFTGHNGWIELDVEDGCNLDEVRHLAEESYRHFALKRMLKALDGAT